MSEFLQGVCDMVVVESMLEPKRESTIVLLDDVKQLPQNYGKVMSVGENVKNIRPGDVVLSHPNGGMAFMLNGKVHRVLKYQEVYGVYSNNVE